MDRFFSDTPIQGNNVVLEGPEANHLARVLRAQPGDQIELFDGSGAQFVAEVSEARRSQVRLQILEKVELSRELPFRLTVATALPKGDRQKWLVEKLVELGVTTLVPLTAKRSVVRPNEKNIDKFRRGVIEASKQCRRNRLMQIGPATEWGDFLAQQDDLRLVAHPYAHSVADIATGAESITLAIGPEGGFTDDEIHAAVSQGWQAINFGPRIMRIETAAVAITAHILTRVSQGA